MKTMLSITLYFSVSFLWPFCWLHRRQLRKRSAAVVFALESMQVVSVAPRERRAARLRGI